MSYSSLWEIDRKWSGREYSVYHNSWLFCPVIWDILMCKYIEPEDRYIYGRIWDSFTTWIVACNKEESNIRFAKLNDRINNSAIQYDRVLWELSNLSVFNAKDKEFVADCISEFVKNNIVGNPKYLESEHIAERFAEVAKDIRDLPRRVKFFVIHPTSCDDNVEWWFNRKRLSSWKKFVCEFTLIENRRIIGFASNMEMCADERCSPLPDVPKGEGK